MINSVAQVAFLLWLPIAVLIFLLVPRRTATAISITAATLLLPAIGGIPLRGLPDLDRDVATALGAFIGCVVFARSSLLRATLGRGPELLLLLAAIGALETAALNGDPRSVGPTVIPGMEMYDGMALAVRQALVFGIPFILGRVMYRKPTDLIPLLSVLAAAGLAYSVLVLWEVRMSPQLHRQVYGVHPHSFAQQIRSGGWRPMVFVGHGLVLSTVMLQTGLAALVLARARVHLLRLPSWGVSAFLGGVLVLCKSLGSILYGLLSWPLLAIFRPRVWAAGACALALVTVLYPVLRSADLVPTEGIVRLAERISEERASSLGFRFEHEERLLDHALERPWFGWGTWGRQRLFDEYTGRDTSVTDGFWIILLGSQGVVGFLGVMGLLLLPLGLAYRRTRRPSPMRDRILVAGLAWIVAVSCVDLLVNATATPILFLMSGALASVSLRLRLPSERRLQAEV